MTRVYASEHRKGVRDYPDPFPVHTLRRVDRPTTQIIDDQVQRVDEQQGGFPRAGRGEFGPFLQKEYSRFVMKHPLSGAMMDMGRALGRLVDGAAAAQRAPLTDDPAANVRHIKETAITCGG